VLHSLQDFFSSFSLVYHNLWFIDQPESHQSTIFSSSLLAYKSKEF